MNDDLIARVARDTDLATLIREDMDLKAAGGDWIGLCPFHSEKTPSFTVVSDHKKSFYHCFGCGAHGDALDWMQQYHRLPFRESLQELAGRLGYELLPEKDLGAVRQRRGKRVAAEIEEALLTELFALDSVIGARVRSRKIPQKLRDRFPHLRTPYPDGYWDREIEAAQRTVNALYALYGVTAR